MEHKTNGLRRYPNRTATDIIKTVRDNGDKVWNVKDLSNEIGLSPDAVRKRIQRGVIPAHKEGRSWYILKSEYISNLRQK